MDRTAFAFIFIIIILGDYIFFIPGYNKRKFNHTPRREKLIWKGLSIGVLFLLLTAGFAAKLISGNAETQDFLWVLGMLFCAVGDIVLEIKFFGGVILFLLGHGSYITAMLMNTTRLSPAAVAAFVIIATAGAVVAVKRMGKKNRLGLVIYNIVVSLSLAIGANLVLYHPNSVSLVCAGTGAALLVVSDLILTRNRIIGVTETRSMMCLSVYFAGQALIAASMWM